MRRPDVFRIKYVAGPVGVQLVFRRSNRELDGGVFA